MKFNLAGFIFCVLILFSSLSAQVFKSSTEISSTSIDSIDIQADNITITFTGSSLRVAGNFLAENRSGVTIRFANPLSSFWVEGQTKLTGSSLNGVKVTGPGTGTFYPYGNVTLKNANITGMSVALDTQYGPNITIDIEKSLLEGDRYAAYLRGTPIFKALFSKFVASGSANPNHTMYINYSSAPNPMPSAEFCYFYKQSTNSKYINNIGTGLVFDLEGSNFGGSALQTNGIGGTVTYDNNPYATGDPILGTMTFGVAGSGTAGINYPKVIPPNTVLYISESLTIPAGVSMRLGYDRATNSYPGGSTLAISPDKTITVAGGSFNSESTNAANTIQSSSGQWGGLVLQSGVTTIRKTSIGNATKAIDDRGGTNTIGGSAVANGNSFSNISPGPIINVNKTDTATSLYQYNTINTEYNASGMVLEGANLNNVTVANNTFNGESAAQLRVNASNIASPKINSNTISFGSGGYGIRVEGGWPSFIGNIITAGTGDAIQITGGKPSFTGNNDIRSALRISGTADPTLTFTGNKFATGVKVDASATDPAVFNLINNDWGGVPSTANFSGTSEIRYEPWTGNGNSKVPEPIFNAFPPNGYTTINAISALSFGLDDIGYHGDAPLQYRVKISAPDDPTFTAPGQILVETNPGTNHPRGEMISHSGFTASQPGTYYWTVSAVNTKTGNNAWGSSPDYSFTIGRPNIQLNLTSSHTQASAGEQVDYTVTFRNGETSPMGNVAITTVLPDDVYWNGVLRFTGKIGMGAIKIIPYASLDTSAPISGVVNFSAADRNNANMANIIYTPNDNVRVRRFDVTMTALPANATGNFVYQTVVK